VGVRDGPQSFSRPHAAQRTSTNFSVCQALRPRRVARRGAHARPGWPHHKSASSIGPADARRRWPSPRPAAPPASRASPFARAGEAHPHRVALAGPALHRCAPPEPAGPRTGAARSDGGTEARRPAAGRAGSPLRGRRGGAGGKAARDSTAWWGRPAPNDGCDDPPRPELRSPGSGSHGPDGATPAVTPAGPFGYERRPPRLDRPDRASSPPGWRRKPGAGTFPRERARRPRGVHPWSETQKLRKVLQGRT
jgi:hypothetical protein